MARRGASQHTRYLCKEAFSQDVLGLWGQCFRPPHAIPVRASAGTSPGLERGPQPASQKRQKGRSDFKGALSRESRERVFSSLAPVHW